MGLASTTLLRIRWTAVVKWWPFHGSPQRDERDLGGGPRVCLAAEMPVGHEARYSLAHAEVCPTPSRVTDSDVRHLLAGGLVRLCHEHGPSRVALEAGCDEKTIRRARDEENTLGLATVLNLALFDDRAVAPLFAAIGKRLVDINPKPVSFPQIAAVASELSAEVHRAVASGGINHTNKRKLQDLAFKLGVLCQGAGVSG